MKNWVFIYDFLWISCEINEWEMEILLRKYWDFVDKMVFENDWKHIGSVFHKFQRIVFSIFNWYSARFSIKFAESQINL